MADTKCAYCGVHSHMRVFAISTTKNAAPALYGASVLAYGAALCSNCYGINIAIGSTKSMGVGKVAMQGMLTHQEFEIVCNDFERDIEGWEPPEMNSQLDQVAYMPAEVAAYWVEAKQALRIQAYRATALLCRSVLEALIKSVESEDDPFKGSLYQKVQQLVDRRIVRPAAEQYMTVVRLLGNIAAHGDLTHAPTADEARAAMQLIDYLIDDFYIAPGVAKEFKLPKQ